MVRCPEERNPAREIQERRLSKSADQSLPSRPISQVHAQYAAIIARPEACFKEGRASRAAAFRII